MGSQSMLRDRVRRLVAEIYQNDHADRSFTPGETRVNYAGRVFDERELIAAVEASLDFWLTAGPRAELFEQRLAEYVGVGHALAVNSGSSANLVAVTSLCSRQLARPLESGDEVITAAVGFPTTVAPIVQNRLVPVFVDCELETYNLDPSQLEPALSDRTRAVFLAHTMGIPVDMRAVMAFARDNDLIVIEDACDALGSTYQGRMAGSFGSLATLSFYPAHHITTGEGGAVLTDSADLARICRSVRDWGRDCQCGHDSPPEGACGRRFGWNIPGVDEAYDHRYLYTEIGYNLKMTDIQAAIGLVQMETLPGFVAARKENYARLFGGLKPYEEFLILPTADAEADPSWFAFPVTVRPGAPFTRRDLTAWLEERNIETRVLFAGNVVRQPGYRNIEHRAIGDLPNADLVLRSAFFIGVFPGLDADRIAYILEAMAGFFRALD
jgi:CDP-6-deoxy-D-xylo-4-hexulose-3-dehydrase